MKRIVLYETHCRRCGKPVTTANRSLYGLDALKAQYDRICHDCMTDTERNELLDKMGQGISKTLA